VGLRIFFEFFFNITYAGSLGWACKEKGLNSLYVYEIDLDLLP